MVGCSLARKPTSQLLSFQTSFSHMKDSAAWTWKEKRYRNVSHENGAMVGKVPCLTVCCVVVGVRYTSFRIGTLPGLSVTASQSQSLLLRLQNWIAHSAVPRLLH